MRNLNQTAWAKITIKWTAFEKSWPPILKLTLFSTWSEWYWKNSKTNQQMSLSIAISSNFYANKWKKFTSTKSRTYLMASTIPKLSLPYPCPSRSISHYFSWSYHNRRNSTGTTIQRWLDLQNASTGSCA